MEEIKKQTIVCTPKEGNLVKCDIYIGDKLTKSVVVPKFKLDEITR